MELNGCQRRFWLETLLHPGSSTQVGWVFQIKGNLNKDILEQSIRRVVAEVETLHSVCALQDGEVVLVKQSIDRLCVERRKTNRENTAERWLDEFGRRPFDLTEDLPMRVLLVALPRKTYRLEFAFHHICIDSKSAESLFVRISDTYRDLLAGRECPERNLPLLADYKKWEQLHDPDSLKEKGLDYWKHFFEKIPASILFPGRDGNGKVHECLEFKLGQRLNRELYKLAGRMHTTPFRIMMSVWMWVLSAYSANRRIVINYAVNIRPDEFRDLIAPFVNNLAAYADLSADPVLKDTVEECTRQRRESRPFQHILLPDIVNRLRADQVISSQESFLNVAFNYVAWGKSQKLFLVGTETAFYRRVRMDESFDLILEMEPDGSGYSRIIYNKMFTAGFIRSMQLSLVRALGMLIVNPEMHFSEIPWLSRKEQRKVQYRTGSVTSAPEEVYQDFLTCFARTVRLHGNTIALYIGKERVTYRELNAESDAIARAIRDKYRSVTGTTLQPGCFVGMCLKRDSHYIAAILGIMKTGAAYVPLDPAYPEERLSFMAEDCGIRCVVTTGDLSGKTGIAGELYLEEVKTENSGGDLVAVSVAPDSPAYVIYTSGTTGRPKGVVIHYRNLSFMIRNALKSLRLHSRMVQLQYANVGFDASVLEIFPALVKGATLCVALEEERIRPGKLVALLQKRKVGIAYIPHGMLAQIDHKLPALHTLISGGETPPAELMRRWGEGRRVLNMYGPTENSVFTTVHVMDHVYSNDIGKPINGVSCYVLDEYRHPVPDEVPGELWIGGWQLGPGYINRPELNREKYAANPFVIPGCGVNDRLYRTGDLVRRLPNGHLLFMGRIDSQVKIRGFRIELGEIENCLNTLEGVDQSIVLLHETDGIKRLVAYIRPEGGDRENLRKKLLRLLPEYMVPSAFVFLDAFPLTLNGKIDRCRLPAPEWKEKEYVAPVTGTERVLAAIAGKILAVGSVSVEDDLFAIGMSSLIAVAFCVQAEKAGISVPVSTVYHERTIRKIAATEKNRVCCWFAGFDPNRPVVVWVCGHMDYGVMSAEVAGLLSRFYNVLVLESYHDYTGLLPEKTDFPGLLGFYERILTETLPSETEIRAFAGHCFGGEIAYALAALWHRKKDCLPAVWMFNAMARRKMPDHWMQMKPLHSENQKILLKIALKKRKLTECLVNTSVMPVYKGEVVLFVASRFTDRLAGPDLPALSDEKVVELFRKAHEKNPEEWALLAPDLQVRKITGNHWTMLSGTGIRELEQWLGEKQKK